MVNAVNNLFGKKILDHEEVTKTARKLNEFNRKQNEKDIFGTENGYFHTHTILVCLNEVGYKCEKIVFEEPMHIPMSEIDSGKYLAMGYTNDNNYNAHAIAIDGDKKLCICDTEKGYLPLSEYAIIKCLPFGIASCFQITCKE